MDIEELVGEEEVEGEEDLHSQLLDHCRQLLQETFVEEGAVAASTVQAMEEDTVMEDMEEDTVMEDMEEDTVVEDMVEDGVMEDTVVVAMVAMEDMDMVEALVEDMED